MADDNSGQRMDDDALSKRNEVQDRIIRAIIGWLEKNQPDVFRRGLWEAIHYAQEDAGEGKQ